MIRETDRRDLEILDRNLWTVQDKVELPLGRPAGVGRFVLPVGADKARGGQKEIKLPITPEDIEISSNNDWPVTLFDDAVKMLELILAVSIGEGKMHQEDHQFLQNNLYHQPLDALFKIMKPMFKDGKSGQYSIALSVQDRQPSSHGPIAILGFHNMKMTEPFGNTLGLAFISCTERTAVHLNQADDIRLHLLEKTYYLVKDGMGVLEIPGIGDRGMEPGTDTGTISDIIEQEAHVGRTLN